MKCYIVFDDNIKRSYASIEGVYLQENSAVSHVKKNYNLYYIEYEIKDYSL